MPAARRTTKMKVLASVLTKARRMKLPQPIAQHSIGQSATLRLSISCPHVGVLAEPRTLLSVRQYSSAPRSCPLATNQLHQLNRYSNVEVSKRSFASCNAGCPCPFPCGPCGCKGGCGCLPPPCNTPPKCLQYMTGYYYYPYGTWFCGPYHVSGTCAPVGANCPCPCPCPAKCCPACVCAPSQNFGTNKNIADSNQFPVEVPCPNVPKIPLENRTGFTKIFNYSIPNVNKKDPQSKQKPTTMPPCLSTMICPNTLDKDTFKLIDKEPRINSSYPVPKAVPKPRLYHTKTNIIPSESSDKASTFYKQKYLKYSCYQTRQKVATPIEKTRIIVKESKNGHRHKLVSLNNTSTTNKKRRSPRPDVDIEIKPYDE